MNEGKKLPPRQVELENEWPGRTAERIGKFDRDKWRLKITGLVEEEKQFTFKELKEFPFAEIKIDFHCVEGWSLTDMNWGGVLTIEIKKQIKIKSEAKYVFLISEGGYTTSLPIDEFFKKDAILAYKVNGEEINREQGFPLRLIISDKYAYKNIKYLTEIRFIREDRLGYWEERGYHNNADIWKEERFNR